MTLSDPGPHPYGDGRKDDAQEYRGYPYGAGQDDTRPYEVQQYEVQQYDTRPYEVQQYDTRPYEVQQYDTRPYEVQQYEVQHYDAGPYGVQPHAGQPQQGQPYEAGYGAGRYPQAPYRQAPYPVQPVAYGYPMVDPRQAAYQADLEAARRSRMAAGLLGIFLGTFGIHNFYLGRTGVAVAQLLITLLSLGVLAPVVWLWALIEGVLILTGAASFRTDAKGIPLRD